MKTISLIIYICCINYISLYIFCCKYYIIHYIYLLWKLYYWLYIFAVKTISHCIYFAVNCYAPKTRYCCRLTILWQMPRTLLDRLMTSSFVHFALLPHCLATLSSASLKIHITHIFIELPHPLFWDSITILDSDPTPLLHFAPLTIHSRDLVELSVLYVCVDTLDSTHGPSAPHRWKPGLLDIIVSIWGLGVSRGVHKYRIFSDAWSIL